MNIYIYISVYMCMYLVFIVSTSVTKWLYWTYLAVISKGHDLRFNNVVF